MCSFPEPDAIESATSNSFEIKGLIFSCISCFRLNRGCEASTSTILHFSFIARDGAPLSFTRIMFSQSILFTNAETCPRFSLSFPTKATSSISSINEKGL